MNLFVLQRILVWHLLIACCCDDVKPCLMYIRFQWMRADFPRSLQRVSASWESLLVGVTQVWTHTHYSWLCAWIVTQSHWAPPPLSVRGWGACASSTWLSGPYMGRALWKWQLCVSELFWRLDARKGGLQDEVPFRQGCPPAMRSHLEGVSFWVILERVFSVIVVMLAEQHENHVLSLLESYLTTSVRVGHPELLAGLTPLPLLPFSQFNWLF